MGKITEKDIQYLKSLVLKDIDDMIVQTLTESMDTEQKNTELIIQQKFCGTPGVTLVSPKLLKGETTRTIYFFDLIDKETHEYDIYYAKYNTENKKLSMKNIDQTDDERIKDDALKNVKSANIKIRDVYKDKDDLKSFFENMNCDVEDIFKTLENMFCDVQIQNECVTENDEPNKEDKEQTPKDNITAEKKNAVTKKPEEKHANAIRQITENIIKSKEPNAFLNLCRLFAYIEKEGEKNGYSKTLDSIIASISKK